MSENKKNNTSNLDRKDFLKTFSLAPLTSLMAGERIQGKAVKEAAAVRYTNTRTDDVVPVGIIGFGEWGREIASTLERNPKVKIAGVCDTFPIMLTRAERTYGDVKTFENHRQMLDDPDIPAVIVATPTHQHRDVVIDALQAGKHVYCEFPMASTIEDAQAMKEAAIQANRQIFQVGLQYRVNPQHRDVFQFIRSGAVGRPTYVRSQWHNKTSWRRTSATAERARELNWRLDSETSLGLIGEIGLHNIDMASWYLNELPSAVHGFGQVQYWRDGREVPDNVQVVVEFPSGVNMICACSLTTSFDGRYDMYYGSDSAILLRDKHAWMFKEVDAPMLGWEVYARRDRFHGEIGIALVADATQLDAQDVDPFEDDPNVETPLYYSLDSFIDNNIFGPFPPMAGYKEGYNATLIAVKAKEAILSRNYQTIGDELYSME
jgi:predicted dehydrogenase